MPRRDRMTRHSNASPESVTMSVFESPRTVPLGAITTHSVVAAADRLLAKLRVWRLSRETEFALSKLSDHNLADIGLRRVDISALSERLARR